MSLQLKFRTQMFFCILLGISTGLQAETNLEQAARLIKAKAFQEAQVLLERALQSDPRNAEAMGMMSGLYLASKNPDKALEFAEKAIQIDPVKARYYLAKGQALNLRLQQVNVLRKLSVANEMRGAFEKGVQVEPKNREARYALFDYYFKAPGIAGGGLDKAKAFAEQTQALDAPIGHYLKAMVFQKQKNPGAVQAECRLALTAGPRYAPAYNLLGYAELEMKQVDLALEHFRKQVDLDPENANSYDSLGDGWMAKGRPEEAIQSYRKALSLSPLFVAAQRHLGTALEQTGRRDEAIQHYRQCAQLWGQQGNTAAIAECKARLKALGVKE